MYIIFEFVWMLSEYNGTISGRQLNLEESGQVAARQMQSQGDEIVRVIQKLHQKGTVT